jgi:hypothetical protein
MRFWLAVSHEDGTKSPDTKVSKKVVALSSINTVIIGQASRPMNACFVENHVCQERAVSPQVVGRRQRKESYGVVGLQAKTRLAVHAVPFRII